MLWLYFQPMIDWLQSYFVENDGFKIADGMLSFVGMGAIKTFIVPLLAMWMLLPLIIVTTLICMGILGMPMIVNHLAARNYPALEKRRGGSLLGSLWVTSSSILIFVLAWIITLPTAVIPPLGFITQLLLWGWLTYRVMAYDALAEHADLEERAAIMSKHRTPLLVIGAATGALGAAPGLLWLGGAFSVVFFPFLAAFSIWLYVLVFSFTGLWFTHYCLTALNSYRGRVEVNGIPEMKDIN